MGNLDCLANVETSWENLDVYLHNKTIDKHTIIAIISQAVTVEVSFCRFYTDKSVMAERRTFGDLR